MQTNAAVIYENGDPGVLRYEDVPEPECPDGFVVVDAEAISIEGGDLLARATGQPPAGPHVVGGVGSPWPRPPLGADRRWPGGPPSSFPAA